MIFDITERRGHEAMRDNGREAMGHVVIVG